MVWKKFDGKIDTRDMLTGRFSAEMTILQIGCGSGYFSKDLLKTKADIINKDISLDFSNIINNLILLKI